MDNNTLMGLAGALLVGLVLGIMGGGGSILSVPLFVYVLNIDPILATAYSLFIVGIVSFFGAIRSIQANMVDFKTGFLFALPALISIYLTRKYFVPWIPHQLFSVGDFNLTKEIGIMLFFAIIMLLSAYFILREKEEYAESSFMSEFRYFFLSLEGFLIGIITGIVGAGGGFLIVPAMIILAKLPVKKAVGTSLMVVSINSLIGFLGDVQNTAIDWSFLLTFAIVAIIGMFVGMYFNHRIDDQKLKKIFGVVVLGIGCSIILSEIFS